MFGEKVIFCQFGNYTLSYNLLGAVAGPLGLELKTTVHKNKFPFLSTIGLGGP